MVWSKWKSSLLILAAAAGFAWAQMPYTEPHPVVSDGAIYLTVAEAGKSPQKCKLIGYWEENGHVYAEVQAVDTGEIITMMDPPLPPGAPQLIPNAGPAPGKAVTKIFRWGNSKTCPSGFPQPPASLACESCGHGPMTVASGGCGSGCQTWNSGTGSTQIVTSEPQMVGQPVPVTSSPSSRPNILNKLFGPKTETPPATTVITPPKVAGPDAPVAKTGTTYPQSLAELAGGNPAAPPAASGKAPTQVAMNNNAPGYGGYATPVPNGIMLPTPVTTDSAPALKTGVPLPPPPPPPSSPKTVPDMKQPPLPVSKTMQPNAVDPLNNTDNLIPDAVKKKLDVKPGDVVSGPPSKQNGAAQVPGYPGAMTQQPGAAVPPPPNGGVPLGMQSVNAAYNGAPGPGGIKYFPYPVVTTPAPTFPPYPPPPAVPSAPQPAQYVNAFTPPLPPESERGNNPMMAGNPYMYGNPYAGGYPMMVPGYGQPMMAPPMMAQGYPYPAPGYGSPYQGSPANPMGVARTYQGPLPPNPMQNPMVSPVAYQPNPMLPYPPANFANPAMDRPATPAAPPANVTAQEAVYQLLTTLKTAVSPAQREWAVMGLAKYDWHNEPHLVQGLLVAAKEDPAATVRMACVKTMVRMGVTQDIYAGTLQTMRNDVDPRVRQAVEEAMGGPSSTPGLPNAVTPAGHSEK